MTTALALRRCRRCGAPLGSYATFCRTPHCVALYEAWADRMGLRHSTDLDDDGGGAHDAWIEEHAHEWEKHND